MLACAGGLLAIGMQWIDVQASGLALELSAIKVHHNMDNSFNLTSRQIRLKRTISEVKASIIV